MAPVQLDLFGNQRWRVRRSSYRPPAETIRTTEYDVEEMGDDATAKAFVVEHHYSASYPAARYRFGLYRAGTLAGTAVFSHPCAERVLSNVFPDAGLGAVELGRFVLLDEVPGNGETWFLARCFERLTGRVQGVVSFSDPFPRSTAEGRIVHPGHVGTIYQASNGVYLGRGTARTLRLLPDGRVMSARAISKIRAGERGWRYSAALLEEFGADPCEQEDRSGWLARWLQKLTRAVRHPGNHKYAWALGRRRLKLPRSMGYPKREPTHATAAHNFRVHR